MNSYTLRKASKKMPTMSDMMGREHEEYFQRLCFDMSQLPEIGSWQVGKEYLLVVKVKMVEHSIEEEESKTVEEGDFDVLQVGAFKPEMDKYGDVVKNKLGMK